VSYTIDFYERNQSNTLRFILGKTGNKVLFVIGLNPSTADDSKPDRTISKLLKFAHLNGYDGFVMLNLYPQRTPYPKDLDEEKNQVYHVENLERILAFINEYQSLDILAAWGDKIMIRNYLIDCLKDIIHVFACKNTSWFHIGDYTKNGHPRHPSRTAYNLGFNKMNMDQYLKKVIR